MDVPKFYTPVTNLLADGEEKLKWRGMRTVGQMRFELGLKAPQKDDSIYKVYIFVKIFVFFCFSIEIRDF